MARKALLIGYVGSEVHDTGCRNAFITDAPSGWECNIAFVGSGTPSGIIVAYRNTFEDCVQYAIDNAYTIIFRPYAFGSQANVELAYLNKILFVGGHHNNEGHYLTLDPPYLLKGTILVGGGVTSNLHPYGPGLEVFDHGPYYDPIGHDISESGACAYISAKLAHILDAGYNYDQARQVLRQISSLYPDWTMDDGYGIPDLAKLPGLVLDIPVPLEISIEKIDFNHVKISWVPNGPYTSIVISIETALIENEVIATFIPADNTNEFIFFNDPVTGHDTEVLFKVTQNYNSESSYSPIYSKKAIKLKKVIVNTVQGGLM